jgi:hypothetical protein
VQVLTAGQCAYAAPSKHTRLALLMDWCALCLHPSQGNSYNSATDVPLQ